MTALWFYSYTILVHNALLQLRGGRILAQSLASSDSLSKGSGSNPGGAKVMGTHGICKYLPLQVSSYVKICMCLLCSVCSN